ncbi:pyridoxal-phosphate dependent enzyme [Spirillospora sp. NPDC047279]|uniref:PLP-dependent cysteine synthase family protein n=1 Tax=Spirillospora sp. NPDC047279 TaxID=3155478 RepID=UPI0033FF08BE
MAAHRPGPRPPRRRGRLRQLQLHRGGPLSWAAAALERLDGEAAGAAPTPLLPYPGDARILLKDESAHSSGSLKHRPVRTLLRGAVASGALTEGMAIITPTSGNTAVAAAWFARLLGLRMIAVVPGRTRPDKAARIERHGGECRRHDPPLAVYDEARRLAAEIGGHVLDPFAPVDDRSLAVELFGLLDEPPAWVVAGAGSGATSAALGRHVREAGLPTRIAVADPEHSAYFAAWAYDVADYATGMPSRIDGIGRPRVEPGFDASVVDVVIPVEDDDSLATARHLHEVTGIPAGPSSGTCLRAALRLAAGRGDGTIVSIVADAPGPLPR